MNRLFVLLAALTALAAIVAGGAIAGGNARAATTCVTKENGFPIYIKYWGMCSLMAQKIAADPGKMVFVNSTAGSARCGFQIRSAKFVVFSTSTSYGRLVCDHFDQELSGADPDKKIWRRLS